MELQVKFNPNVELEKFTNRDDDEGFETMCALIVKADAESPIIENLKRRLRAPLSQGGCQLLVKVVKKTNIGKKAITKTALVVGCDNRRLLLEAEMSGINKVGPHGDMVPFTWEHHVHQAGDCREDATCDMAASLFSQSEKLRLLSQMLDRLRVSTEDMNTLDDVALIYVSVPHLRNQGIVTDAFPLHDYETLNRLAGSWYRTWSYEQPYDGIRDYFGEKVAMYFCFLSFYSKTLIVCSALAIAYYFSFVNSPHAQAIFAAINLVILTLFLKFWRRRCATIAYYWGTLGFVRFETPRPEFRGKLETSPVTCRPEPVYPSWRRWRTILGVSYPIVCIWLAVAVFIIWLYFWVQFRVDQVFMNYNYVLGYIIYYMPTIVYSIIIEILNRLYKRTAVWLTNLENHRVQSEYENHLMTKLILFHFVNCFGWLFYVAFIMRDMAALQRYLACLLITLQIIQQLIECLLPYLRICLTKRFSKNRDNMTALGKRVFTEEGLDIYEDTFNDYLELWLQFGYAFMFSSVYPLAAFWALLNNVSEMRCDAFKLCKSMRRPIPQAADSIGPWQPAFDALVAISVVTNCALLGLSKSFQDYFVNVDGAKQVVMVVFIEHVILLVIIAIHKLIYNVPEKIFQRLARVDFAAMQALVSMRAAVVSRRPELHRASSLVNDMTDGDSYRRAITSVQRSAEV